MKKIFIFFLFSVFAFQTASLFSDREDKGKGRGQHESHHESHHEKRENRTPSMSRPAPSSAPKQRRAEAPKARGASPSPPKAQARPQAREGRRVMAPLSQPRQQRQMSQGRQQQSQKPREQKPREQIQRQRPQSLRRERIQERTPSLSHMPQRRLREKPSIKDAVKQFRGSRDALKRPFRKDLSKDRFSGDRHKAGRVRDRFRDNHPHHRDWFSSSFFDHHHYHPHYFFHGGHGWGRWGWEGLNSWLGYGWDYPLYYGYDEAPIEITNVYENYYNTSPLPNEQAAWLPIGVFVLGKDEEEASYSDMFLQLALDKQGNLGGTYYNSTEDQLYSIEGLVDQENQMAAWRVSENADSAIMSTGLFNLTQDVAPLTILFSNNVEQNWVLVRIEDFDQK